MWRESEGRVVPPLHSFHHALHRMCQVRECGVELLVQLAKPGSEIRSGTKDLVWYLSFGKCPQCFYRSMPQFRVSNSWTRIMWGIVPVCLEGRDDPRRLRADRS